MVTIIIFAIILGVLIFVHELGHFVVARRNGVRAEEFGFGFPPRIIGIQKIHDGKKGRWRIIHGRDGDDEKEMKDRERIYGGQVQADTIYSLNWIPLGGFVKIKGEDGGDKNDPDSFSGKSAWSRTKILVAGVMMNFVLAWFLISAGLMIGAPEAVNSKEKAVPDSKIQISDVVKGSPAEQSGMLIGDEILKVQKTPEGKMISLKSVQEVQDYINSERGRTVSFDIMRGKEKLSLEVVPRVDVPEGQGPVGVSLSETAIVKYPWYQAIYKGLLTVFDLIIAMLLAFYGIIKNIIAGQGVGSDVSGPVGIAILTKQVAGLGFVYLLQFTALLSINLGIINILPIPALDGGRVLFIMIEKLKGSPVSQKVEQIFHTVGFALLIILMMLVTFKDVMKLIK